MNYRGPGFYPPEGHDWVQTDPVRKLEAHNAALEHELYQHRVADFRRAFYTLMETHRSIDDGHGWLLFDDQSQDTDVKSAVRREVLLTSGAAMEDPGADIVPQLRIITNEMYPSEAADAVLTEDVTIEPDGHAQYYVGGIILPDDRPAEWRALIQESRSPIFVIDDGKLKMTPNTRTKTPVVNVYENGKTQLDPVQPFGDSINMVDKHYALNKAVQLLAGVSSQEPKHSYEF